MDLLTFNRILYFRGFAVKNILENNKSSDMPKQTQNLLFFRLLISKRTQSILMILISLLLIAEVGSFRNHLIGTGSVLLGLAAIGSYFRKHWVKYCFFTWGIFISLRGSILLLAAVKSGATNILELNAHIHMLILQCVFAFPFFCAGYLARLFFDLSTQSTKKSKSINLTLAYWAAIFALMLPSLVQLIAGSTMLPISQIIVEQAVTLNVPDKWLMITATLPRLIFNIGSSIAVVILLAMLFREWSRWYIAASLLIMLLYLGVGVMNFLLAYMARTWSSNLFFDGYETVILPVTGILLGILIGGLFTEYIKKRSLDEVK